MTLTPCPHREILPGPLATPADLLAWSAELSATPCPRCAATPAPRLVAPPAELPPLPPAIVAALTLETRAGALRAQRTLDALEVPADLYPAIAERLSRQPGTSPWWRRWWAGWRGGALVGSAPASG